MNNSTRLYNLQLVDSQIKSINQQLNEIDLQINDYALLQSLEVILKRSTDQFETGEQELAEAESSVKQQRIKIEQTEAALYAGSVKDPKELQSMQDEVHALKRFLSVLEERQLEAMLFMDDVAEALESARNNHSTERAKRDQTVQDLTLEKDRLIKKRTGLERERETATNNIDPGLYQTYMGIFNSKGGIAVAKINDQACDSCGTRLTAANFQLVKSPTQIIRCSTCGRILHYAD